MDRVERAVTPAARHALRRSLKKTEINPEEDASETTIQRKRTTKNTHVHTGPITARSDRRPHPAIQVQITSATVPRIMNAISTARAILPDLNDADVGIPQLIVLISESFQMGDPAAQESIRRAVSKTDAPPYMRAAPMMGATLPNGFLVLSRITGRILRARTTSIASSGTSARDRVDCMKIDQEWSLSC